MKRIVAGFAIALAFAGCKPTVEQRRTIHFTLAEDGKVFLHIQDAEGNVLRELAAGEHFSKGPHAIPWDGKTARGQPADPGEYRWTGVVHGGIGLKLRGWACHSGEVPWDTDDPRRGWAGEVGVPTAVCADGERVYLGWSSPFGGLPGRSRPLNQQDWSWPGYHVLACDLDGHLLWGAALPKSTGCEALSVDGGVVAVLGRENDKTDAIYRLNAADGHLLPWPGGDGLAIESLWPTDAATKPLHANGMAMRAGRLYLTFTEAQFLAVLDSKTGAYLQTVVGGAPELIDVVPTKTESPDRAGELMPADFAMVSLRGGPLGKVLFAHDPLWVMTSDLQPLEREEHVTALSLVGDGAKHHPHSVFVGLGAPFYQVQRRAILASEGFLWSAGKTGGRPAMSPWQPEALGPIHAVALDARGRLWVAEGDVVPPRFTVWETDGREGRLVREFFGPVPSGMAAGRAAILPSNPNIMVGGGCEWRIDPATGRAACLGIIDAEPMQRARFRVAADGMIGLEIEHGDLSVSVFRRRSAGDYVLESNLDPPSSRSISRWRRDRALVRRNARKIELAAGRGTVKFSENNSGFGVWLDGFGEIASLFESEPDKIKWPVRAEPGADMTRAKCPLQCTVTRSTDGKVYLACVETALWNLEVTGLETVMPLRGGKLFIERPR